MLSSGYVPQHHHSLNNTNSFRRERSLLTPRNAYKLDWVYPTEIWPSTALLSFWHQHSSNRRTLKMVCYSFVAELAFHSAYRGYHLRSSIRARRCPRFGPRRQVGQDTNRRWGEGDRDQRLIFCMTPHPICTMLHYSKIPPFYVLSWTYLNTPLTK